jgi:methyltransferase (TIGR00027 family)
LSERPSRTAEAVALLRARETERLPARRVLSDPYAWRFLRAAGSPLCRGAPGGPFARAFAAALDTPPLSTASFVPVRHRVIDDQLRRELTAGAEQVVILGAGLDSRAYRLGAAGRDVPFFEVDHPTVSRTKREIVRAVVGAAPHVRFVAVDLARTGLDAPLREAGFRAGRRTAFVWEGVTYYLDAEAVSGTFRAVRSLGGAGSSVLFDGRFRLARWRLWSRVVMLGGAVLLRAIGEPMTFAFSREGGASPGALLERAGLTLERLWLRPELNAVLREAGRAARVHAAWLVGLGRVPADAAAA